MNMIGALLCWLALAVMTGRQRPSMLCTAVASRPVSSQQHAAAIQSKQQQAAMATGHRRPVKLAERPDRVIWLGRGRPGRLCGFDRLAAATAIYATSSQQLAALLWQQPDSGM